MPKYRGFMNEVTLSCLNCPKGLGAAFSGPRTSINGGSVPTYTVQPSPTPIIATPAPIYTPTVPLMIQPGIPGDIRPITERLIPGEAIVDEIDIMATEDGVPGVDDSGAFPYGDPKGADKTVPVREGNNAGWILATFLAALVLGG